MAITNEPAAQKEAPMRIEAETMNQNNFAQAKLLILMATKAK